MSETSFYYSISGADKFQLLLDRHIRLNAVTGNVIRLSIEVKGTIDIAQLKKQVTENAFLTSVNSLTIESSITGIPRWKTCESPSPVSITEHFTDVESFIPEIVMQRDIAVNTCSLLHVDVVQGKINSIIVLSAHHVIADNQGIQYLVKCISGVVSPIGNGYITPQKDDTGIIQRLINTVKATLFVFSKSPKTLAKLDSPPALKEKTNHHKFSVLRFKESETKLIEECALNNGTRLSKSSFYLAAIAMALKQTVFAGKGDCFFLPVPQNQRRKGSEEVSLGNQLSFLFYAIPFNKLNNLAEATAHITQQMMEQIKEQMPNSYSHLMHTFRFLPLGVYDFFFKLPSKGAVCSFLFTDVGDTLPGIETFAGNEVVEILNFPPAPSPPGITFVCMKHSGSLKFITTFDTRLVSPSEIVKFESSLAALLKG